MSCIDGSSWHTLSEKNINGLWSGLCQIFFFMGFKAGHCQHFLFWVKLSKLNLWPYRLLDGRRGKTVRTGGETVLFVSFWQYFPHSSDSFPHSFSSQEFGKTSLWNKYHSLLCDFWKFVGKTHHSCKFLGHSRPNGLSWPKNLHSLWVFSSLIFPRSRSREMIISS